MNTCHFCGATSKVRFPVEVDIDGEKYCFCKKCLHGMTAFSFWQRINKS